MQVLSSSSSSIQNTTSFQRNLASSPERIRCYEPCFNHVTFLPVMPSSSNSRGIPNKPTRVRKVSAHQSCAGIPVTYCSELLEDLVLLMGSSNSYMNINGKKPLFSFGVITDVQYANIPDGRSFLGVPRYYRHSFQVLQRAVNNWNKHGKLKFCVNFGDIIDGFCPKSESCSAIEKVISEFNNFEGPVYHMLGNHCLYNLPRETLLELLKFPSALHGRAYYDFTPSPEYRFVVLDAYDISAIGWPEDHPNALEAKRVLQTKNPNSDKNSPIGLVDLERRYLMFNGAVGEEQLLWLEGVLQDASTCNQKVIVCCHLPLHPESSSHEALLWNYDEVLELIHRYNCVKACFGGHDHKGGYSIDSYGVHHRVLEAALECPPGTDAFGHVDVFDDRISLSGVDRMACTEMVFSS